MLAEAPRCRSRRYQTFCLQPSTGVRTGVQVQRHRAGDASWHRHCASTALLVAHAVRLRLPGMHPARAARGGLKSPGPSFAARAAQALTSSAVVGNRVVSLVMFWLVSKAPSASFPQNQLLTRFPPSPFLGGPHEDAGAACKIPGCHPRPWRWTQRLLHLGASAFAGSDAPAMCSAALNSCWGQFYQTTGCWAGSRRPACSCHDLWHRSSAALKRLPCPQLIARPALPRPDV